MVPTQAPSLFFFFSLTDLSLWFISVYKGISIKCKIALDLMNGISRLVV